MRILALAPYYGGSHKAFLDGWSSRSRHEWTILGLPAYRWKWRMRQAGYTFANLVRPRVAAGEMWDLIFCSDMLNLPEFVGLAPPALRALPTLVYFHENQLTYPAPHATERDRHFAVSNLVTALAADAVWFNSRYHRDVFLGALPGLLHEMPDYPPENPAERIGEKSSVWSPGIDPFPPRDCERREGPLRILWAARWEHDKDPETFFKAMGCLRERGIDFRLSILGQIFNRVPPVFDVAREEFRDRIDRWGYLKKHEAYRAALMETDVFVSTAIHEFFGIGAVEAIAAGNHPVLPHRLAYPELVDADGGDPGEFLYDGGAESLADRLAVLASRLGSPGGLWQNDPDRLRGRVERLLWPRLIPQLDDALESIELRA